MLDWIKGKFGGDGKTTVAGVGGAIATFAAGFVCDWLGITDEATRTSISVSILALTVALVGKLSAAAKKEEVK